MFTRTQCTEITSAPIWNQLWSDLAAGPAAELWHLDVYLVYSVLGGTWLIWISGIALRTKASIRANCSFGYAKHRMRYQDNDRCRKLRKPSKHKSSWHLLPTQRPHHHPDPMPLNPSSQGHLSHVTPKLDQLKRDALVCRVWQMCWGTIGTYTFKINSEKKLSQTWIWLFSFVANFYKNWYYRWTRW